jgi:hypothetical protein
LVIEDESKIPKEYMKEIVETVLDKDRLKEDLAIGPIEGAKLEESFALKTYVNTPNRKAK